MTSLVRSKPPSVTKEMSIDDLWSIHIKMKGELAPLTRVKYACVGKRFCDFIRSKPMTPDSILQWTAYLQDLGNIQPRQINYINSRIRTFLRWLRTIGLVQERLYEVITMLHAPALKEPKMFTEDEYDRIKKYCTGRPWCQVHLWLIILAYRTGMALVDCCHLRWRDVHLDGDGPSYLTIHRIKTVRFGVKAKCHIPLIPGTDIFKWLLHLKDHVERYKRFDGIEDYVHPDAPGLYACTWQSIRNDFKNIFRHVGIERGKSFKNFRNSLCSNLVNSGMSIPLVCKITGHNSVQMLMRYLKPDVRALQDGMAKSYQYSANQDKSGAVVDGLTLEAEVTV